MKIHYSNVIKLNIINCLQYYNLHFSKSSSNQMEIMTCSSSIINAMADIIYIDRCNINVQGELLYQGY